MKKILTLIVLTMQCMYCMAQTNTENDVHSEVMAWSNITGVRLDGELIDFESSLCVGIPGGKIENTGRERQQNVRYRREGKTQIVDIPLHGARFHNLRQLAMTPADAFSIPLTVDKENVNTAAFYNKTQGKGALHVVNNGAACKAEVSGFPASVSHAVVFVTNASQNAEEKSVNVSQGIVTIDMPAESFVTVLF